MTIIMIVLVVIAYILVPRTFWRNKVWIGAPGTLAARRFWLALLFFWLIIPWYIVLKLTGNE